MRHTISTSDSDEFRIARSVRVGTTGILCSLMFEECEVAGEEGMERWQTHADYADVDFNYGPVA